MDRVLDLRKKTASPKSAKKAVSPRDSRVLNYMAVYSTVGDLIDIIDELKDKERIITELEQELGYTKESSFDSNVRQNNSSPTQDSYGAIVNVQETANKTDRPDKSKKSRDSKVTNTVDNVTNFPKKIATTKTDILVNKGKSPKLKKKAAQNTLISSQAQAISSHVKAKSPQVKTKFFHNKPLSPQPKQKVNKEPHVDIYKTWPIKDHSKDMKPSSGNKSPKSGTSRSPKITRKQVSEPAKNKSPSKSPTGGTKPSTKESPQNVPDATLLPPLPPHANPNITSPKHTPRKVHPGVVDPRYRRKKWMPSASFSDTLEVVKESLDDSPPSVTPSSNVGGLSVADLWTTAEADERYKLLMKEHLDLEKAFTALQCDLPLDPLTMVQERYQLEQDLLMAYGKIDQLETKVRSRPNSMDESCIKREKYQLISQNRQLQGVVSNLEERLLTLEEALTESQEEIEDWEFRVLELEQELATSSPKKIEVKEVKIESDIKPVENPPALNYADKWNNVSMEFKSKGIDVREVMKQLEELRNNTACANSDQEKIALLEAHKIMDILDKHSCRSYDQQKIEFVPTLTMLPNHNPDSKTKTIDFDFG